MQKVQYSQILLNILLEIVVFMLLALYATHQLVYIVMTTVVSWLPEKSNRKFLPNTFSLFSALYTAF
jgi:hypothetical protein